MMGCSRWSRSKKGGKAAEEEAAKGARVQSVDYIQGGTLARVVVYEGKGTGRIKAAVRLLGQAAREPVRRLHTKTQAVEQEVLRHAGYCLSMYRSGGSVQVGHKNPLAAGTDLLQIGGRDKVGVAEFSRV